jgi:hypothetical protein
MALMTMALFTVVLAWRLFRRFQMPAQELAFTRMLSIVGLLGLVWTGVLGGRLMFQHAAGIPSKILQAELQDRAEGHEHQPGEQHEHGAPADTAKATHTHPPGIRNVLHFAFRICTSSHVLHAGHDAPTVRSGP